MAYFWLILHVTKGHLGLLFYLPMSALRAQVDRLVTIGSIVNNYG